MIKLDTHMIEIPCPSCGFLNSVTLLQVRVQGVVICRGCKGNLRLQDQMYSTRKAIRSLRRAVSQLERQLGKVAKITIRL